MKYKIFQYALPTDSDLSDLNQFLSQYRITSVRKRIIQQSSAPMLVFVVEYLERSKTTTTKNAKPKVDYQEILSGDEYSMFCRLRDLRKRIAEQEEIPIYTVLTNAQLAEIVQRGIRQIEALKEVKGLGQARIEKYGQRIVEMIQQFPNGSSGTNE